VQSPLKLESHHVQAVSDRQTDVEYQHVARLQHRLLSVAAQKGIGFSTGFVTRLISILISYLNITPLFCYVYSKGGDRACVMGCGLPYVSPSARSYATELCTLLNLTYIRDLFWTYSYGCETWSLVLKKKTYAKGV
jgi:hypothetical protein